MWNRVLVRVNAREKLIKTFVAIHVLVLTPRLWLSFCWAPAPDLSGIAGVSRRVFGTVGPLRSRRQHVRGRGGEDTGGGPRRPAFVDLRQPQGLRARGECWCCQLVVIAPPPIATLGDRWWSDKTLGISVGFFPPNSTKG